jgi:hypothetical protein
MDRTLVDLGEGTVWDYSQDACPDFPWGHRHLVWERQEPGGLAGADGDHDTVRVSSAEDAHLDHSCTLPSHGADRGGFWEVQHGDHGGEFTRLESELSFLQVRATMLLQETIRQVKVEICENRKQITNIRLESIAGAENP